MNNRNYYREINKNNAKILMDAIDKGQYQAGRYIVKIPEFKPAEYYSYRDLENIDFEAPNIKDLADQDILITGNSAVKDTINAYNKNPELKIGVLNFASAYHPGGGFINGALAQEEAICQASTLYQQIKDSKMYRDNKALDMDGLYNNSMNISETVFIRDDRYNFLIKPAKAVVVTCAAPNLNKIKVNNAPKVPKVLKERMELIIQIMIKQKCKVLILGAFGCGVFKNDPVIIAEIWADLLSKYGGHFDKVIFSIFERDGNKNSEAFKEVFKN